MRDSDRLSELKHLTEEGLGGLQADDAMWQRIQAEAAQKHKKSQVVHLKAWIGGVAAVAAALLLFVGGGQKLIQWKAGSSYSAGSSKNAAVSSQSVGASIRSAQKNDEQNLILVGNRAYVLTDAVLSEKSLGEKLGTVQEYTLQPSLSEAELVSSVAAEGEAVYAVKNAGGLVAAKTGGRLCAFQRVDALGKNPSGESLEDTLCPAEQVKSISFGKVLLEDEEARSAMRKLYANAGQVRESLAEGETITITLKGGETLYLLAEGDCVSACGTWYCPEFTACFQK